MEDYEDIDNMTQDSAGESPEAPEQGTTLSLSGMFKDYWIDYASDVILDRSVPDIDDGLKPVQRRILHAMEETDDGRFTKVANIVGNTMQYHPHGDASIKDALVNLGQKELLIDCQGNWGNILTGDDAAAGRYIEARLSKFAKEVVFNPKTTQWKPSYDGRKQEPVTLPIKFPLLLAQGTKGIAVTLTSVILPHNFCELLEGSIKVLQDEPFELFPDFPTGGLIDVSRYNDGALGGRLRIRAKMHYDEKRKAIVITELPYSVTTDVLIDSILKANEKGKIKIKKVDDNTAAEVEIVVYLPAGVSPDQTIDALYAFTSCQISFSPQTCVIVNDKPVFMTTSDILRHNTLRTKELLRQELEIQLGELEDRWHWVSLEKIFFEERIYKIMENDRSKTWDDQVSQMEKAFDPFRQQFKKAITRDDVLKLCEKPVRKISKFDIKKAVDELASIEMTIDEVRNHLAHLTDYTIRYFRHILDKYGKGRERRTEIRSFEDIESTTVALANEKLYVNYTTGFAGWGLKKEEGVDVACECSRLDDIIVFRRDGTFMVTKVQEKGFVGTQECPEILFISVFRKRDERTVYNLIYRDGGTDGYVMVKRFNVTSITRDRDYLLTKGTKGSRVLYFTANPNGEAEVVTVHHVSKPKLKKTSFDFDFKSIAIKGRASIGNILTRNAVRSINLKDEGISTLSARRIWFDESVKRLYAGEIGGSDGDRSTAMRYLGEFKGSDKILAIMQSGSYRTTSFDLANHYDDDLVELRKFNPHTPVTALYRSPDGYPYLKRFMPEPTDRKSAFIEDDGSALISLCLSYYPRLEVTYAADSGKKVASEIIEVNDFIGIKSAKAKGKRVTTFAVDRFTWLEPLLPDPEETEADEDVAADENGTAISSDPNAQPDERLGYAEGTQTQLFNIN